MKTVPRLHDLVGSLARRPPSLLLCRRRQPLEAPLAAVSLVFVQSARKSAGRTMAMSSPYSQHTKESLLLRIQQLEETVARQAAALSALSAEVPSSLSSSPPPPPPQRALDPAQYATRFIALKLAYLGKNYGGFEFQPSGALPTIEEELWKALVRTCLVSPAPGASPDEVGLLSQPHHEYEKCGRTDRGVSAFGQVVSLRVRSSIRADVNPATGARLPTDVSDRASDADLAAELAYPKVLNRLLPPDIRVLAWCPAPPPGFSARFSCRERQYRYFFTDPAYVSTDAGPGPVDHGRLDVAAMRAAAARFVGLHDFRNFCKVDPGKQITNFQRRIFGADVVAVDGLHSSLQLFGASEDKGPRVYSFNVQGSAFLWHQIRHMVAVLFLVGQGREPPEVVSQLLDVAATPRRPAYAMADDAPLVLWDCIFPALAEGEDAREPRRAENQEDQEDQEDQDVEHNDSHVDCLDWRWVADETVQPSRTLVNELWEQWRRAKMDEILANRLLDVATAPPLQRGRGLRGPVVCPGPSPNKSLVFEGGHGPRLTGPYVPLMKLPRLASPEEVNDKYAQLYGFASAEAMRQTDNWRAVVRAQKKAKNGKKKESSVT